MRISYPQNSGFIHYFSTETPVFTCFLNVSQGTVETRATNTARHFNPQNTANNLLKFHMKQLITHAEQSKCIDRMFSRGLTQCFTGNKHTIFYDTYIFCPHSESNGDLRSEER